MFTRESEGVYEFGSKRVKVTVQRDEIQIKVGRVYHTIDEFLDQYTLSRLDRLERRDPLKRLNEKVAAQKVILDLKRLNEKVTVQKVIRDRASREISSVRQR